MRNDEHVSVFLVLIFASLGLLTSVSALEEFKVKRQEVFEFARRPQVTRSGDQVSISFETKGYCDVTVAIENDKGVILRHLASGVLGPKAPAPLKKNTKKQSLVWDGKTDQGTYVDDKDGVMVRVSLGLKPRFERTLYWSPHKRIGFAYPSIKAAPEGIYVAESCEIDQVRLFDHQGNYLRTIHPFPSDRVDKVVGLKKHRFIQDGKTLPLKTGFCQASLLSCGGKKYGGGGIFAMAAANGRVALVNHRLNRLASDGTTGGLPLVGPETSWVVNEKEPAWAPLSVALSPDAKWLYLTGHHINRGWGGGKGVTWINGVLRMPYGENKKPTLFVGELKTDSNKGGSEDGKFRMASSVACDAKGRVYVGDYMNDRVQVFDDKGKHLKSIPVRKPANVAIHQKSGDIYVFSWMLLNRMCTQETAKKVDATMTHLGPLEDPKVKSRCPLPLLGHNATTSWNVPGGLQHRVELDSWADKPTVLILNGKIGSGWANPGEWAAAHEAVVEATKGAYAGSHVRIFEVVDGKLKLKKDFGEEVKNSVERFAPPTLWRQRLIVNPATGRLYVAEGDSGVGKSVNQLVEIRPDSGKIKMVDLPLGAEDLCFDANGLIYIRTDKMVARYDPRSWREIPFDYGEERPSHGFGMGAKAACLISGLVTPGHRSFNFWHLGGIDVSVKGHLVVTTCNGAGRKATPKARHQQRNIKYVGRPYVPKVYPGRMRWGEIHIWDKYGKVVMKDAVPGMGHLNGIGIDRDDNVYMMAASRRLIKGRNMDPKLPRDVSCTLVKVKPGKAKVLSSDSGGGIPVPLPGGARPRRPMDLTRATGGVSGWVENAEWFYGGVGFGGDPGSCVCWNSRFDLDYYNRSFAPEPLRYSVAVLDSSGNLILRVGTYGNVNDGKPLVAAGGPAEPRSIGGDEVGLFYACYVATHTDRRLFIADAGNTRILSVKLGYHNEETFALKDIPDGG